MKNRRLEKFVLFLFLGLFIAAGTGMIVLFRQTYREYTTTQTRETYYRQRLSEAETKLKKKEENLYLLRHASAFIERTIRQRLGYSRPGELIFRFEDFEESVK